MGGAARDRPRGNRPNCTPPRRPATGLRGGCEGAGRVRPAVGGRRRAARRGPPAPWRGAIARSGRRPRATYTLSRRRPVHAAGRGLAIRAGARSREPPRRGHPRHRDRRRRRTTRRSSGARTSTRDLAYFWVRLDGPATPFEPGQYMTDRRRHGRQDAPAAVLGGVGAVGRGHARATSSSSATCRSSGSRPRCGGCRSGHRMRMIGPKGKFMLEPDDTGRTSTCPPGPGIAPFISMIRETMAQGQAAQDRAAQRLLVLGRAGLPARSSRPGSGTRPTG